jgi:uncharacterized protein (DUF608 family)
MSSTEALFELAAVRRFSGRQLREIAFPLGGIGGGTVSLGGRGQLRDWEIFNRPSKGFTLPYSFPALRVQEEGEEPWTRVLEAQFQPPYQGASGVPLQLASGLPRLESAEFLGAYPFARVNFHDPRLPVQVSLTAFNPLIPLNPDDSGLPAAILRYRVRNTGARSVQATVALSLMNPIGCNGSEDLFSNGLPTFGQNLNEFVAGPLPGLRMTSTRHQPTSPLFGTLALLTDWTDCSYRTSFLRPGVTGGGGWWESLLEYWDDLSEDGRLQDAVPPAPSADKLTQYGALALHAELEPGASVELPFILAWSFPNRTPSGCGWAPPEERQEPVGNHYATRFADAWAVAEYAAAHLEELEEESARYVRSVLDSTLPAPVLDGALSNVSTLRTQTCFRTADGEFFGFEGCGDKAGCCHGSCTHVWNYEQTTAYLFPSLSRSLRNTEFLQSTDERGMMSFRTNLPLGSPRVFQAAADGQMGCLMKLYRDWRLTGDDAWLAQLWPAAKRALAFAWIEGGWDADRDGIMEGVQHNTYDVEFHGPNPQTGFWYLGALRAMEEMARHQGEAETAASYRELFERGSRYWDEHLFNGEYYQQDIRSQVGKLVAPGLAIGYGGAVDQEPQYQIGPGCLVDQVVGQYFAHIVGLGYLADAGHIRSALDSVHRYNYHRDLRDHVNVARTYALNDEAATIICTWPHGGRPVTPTPYFCEVMTGFEYAAAIGLIYEGGVEEGLEMLASIRERYDGERRNPWDEAECGHHYARAMAAWAAILALSGFQYTAADARMAFAPRVSADDFRCFWSTPFAWGSFGQRLQDGSLVAWIAVEYGALPLGELALSLPEGMKLSAVEVCVGGTPQPHEHEVAAGALTIKFPAEPLTLAVGQVLTVTAGA